MRPLLLTSAILCVNLMQAQSLESFESISFEPPKGWTMASSNLVRQFTDIQANDFCVITVYGSAVSAGSLSTDFQEEWQQRVLSISTPLESFYPAEKTSPSGLKYMEGGSTIAMSNGGGNLYAHLIVLQINSRRQSMVFGFGSRAMMAKYQQPLQKFLTSVVSADAVNSKAADDLNKNTVAQTSTIPNVASNKGVFYHGMEAVYVGPSPGNNPRYLYLFPDNTFQWGYSQHGYYNYDRSHELKNFPGFCGTYTRSGGTIKLNFADNSDYKPEFSVDEKGNLKNTSSRYTLLKFPNVSGLTLQGNYSKEESGVNTWNGPRPTAAFHSNGRFEDKGLLCMGEMVDYSLPLDQANQRMSENKIPGNGTYQIVDYTLLLRYDDGRQRQLSFYLYEKDSGKSAPELIVVAGQSFVLLK